MSAVFHGHCRTVPTFKVMTVAKPSPYQIVSSAPLLVSRDTKGYGGGVAKRYTLTIRDLPQEEKPREKMLALGPSALTPSELLAVVLQTGTIKEDVLSMTSRILREYGEKSIFSELDVKKLSEDLDIPVARAAQIVAAGELGRRFFKRSRNGAAVIRTAEEVFEYVADMRTLPREHLRGIYLNAHYQVIHDEIISIGTVDANIAHPREIFRPAIASGAAALILVHNHPSGVLVPSTEDIHMTRQVAEAGRVVGIELVDHVIVAEQGFASVPISDDF